MTTFQAWIPPAGAVVDPPVHPKTTVLPIFSDGSNEGDPYRAEQINWSADGDGPRVVAYAVVEEYKPAPKLAREWWVAHGFTYATKDMAICAYRSCIHPPASVELAEGNITHVREVLEGREVVAWAVMSDGEGLLGLRVTESSAGKLAAFYGGTVVRLTGVMPS